LSIKLSKNPVDKLSKIQLNIKKKLLATLNVNKNDIYFGSN